MQRHITEAHNQIADLRALEKALAFSWQLVERVETFALQFGLPDLGVIDLPPEAHSEADAQDLQTAATLYLAAELEASQLLSSVELLAGLAQSGGLRLSRGTAAQRLFQFWRGREQRFSPQERNAFFARLFGGQRQQRLAVDNSYNDSFELLMIDLTEAISTLDASLAPAYRVRAEIGLRTLGQRFAENLLQRSGGMANYIARDVISLTQEALDILKEPAVQQSVGARSVWDVIQTVNRRYQQVEIDVRAHVRRGNAGMQIISWIAHVYPNLRLDTNHPLISGPDDPVIAAAAAWLQTSLAIAERQLAVAEI